YGRYGYGIAAWRLGLTAERARVQFAPHASDEGRVRMPDRAECERLLPALYEKMRDRPGAVSRPSFWWPSVLWANFGAKDKAFCVAVRTGDDGDDDGYVAYTIEGDWDGGLATRRIVIWDLQSTNNAAHIALWRYVFGVDLVATVTITNAAIDDPLR